MQMVLFRRWSTIVQSARSGSYQYTVYWCVCGILKYAVGTEHVLSRLIGGRIQSCPPMLEVRISNSIVGCPRRLVMTKLFATRDVSGNIGTRLGSVGSTCATATPETPPSEQQRTNAMA